MTFIKKSIFLPFIVLGLIVSPLASYASPTKDFSVNTFDSKIEDIQSTGSLETTNTETPKIDASQGASDDTSAIIETVPLTKPNPTPVPPVKPKLTTSGTEQILFLGGI